MWSECTVSGAPPHPHPQQSPVRGDEEPCGGSAHFLDSNVGLLRLEGVSFQEFITRRRILFARPPLRNTLKVHVCRAGCSGASLAVSSVLEANRGNWRKTPNDAPGTQKVKLENRRWYLTSAVLLVTLCLSSILRTFFVCARVNNQPDPRPAQGSRNSNNTGLVNVCQLGKVHTLTQASSSWERRLHTLQWKRKA